MRDIVYMVECDSLKIEHAPLFLQFFLIIVILIDKKVDDNNCDDKYKVS